MNVQKSLKFLQVMAVLEAVSWIFLLVAMFFKYSLGNEMFMRPTGNIHGIFFIFYFVFLLFVSAKMKWTVKEIILSIIAAFLPLATIWADIKIFRKYRQ